MVIDGVKTSTELLTGLWTDISWDGIANEGSVTLKNGKKPEKLLRRIIETTCAVAHKLGCRYIGIEQLDYDENDSVVRLYGVINGDSTGISRAINWSGGGSFVYCELAKQNQSFVERIRDAEDGAELSRIWADMRATGYISHYIDPRDIDEEAEDFKALSFESKQRLFLDLLDKNLLYVSYCDMDDAESGLTEADKAFTRSFYGEV
jgi:adenine-specific DNA-methyltransferase